MVLGSTSANAASGDKENCGRMAFLYSSQEAIETTLKNVDPAFCWLLAFVSLNNDAQPESNRKKLPIAIVMKIACKQHLQAFLIELVI